MIFQNLSQIYFLQLNNIDYHLTFQPSSNIQILSLQLLIYASIFFDLSFSSTTIQQPFISSRSNFFCQQYYVMERLKNLKDQLPPPPTFQYTTDKGCLTLAQRQFYEENGYLIIRKFLKEDDIQRWTQRFLEYCDKKRQPIPGMQVVRDISLAKKNGRTGHLNGEANITKLQDFQLDQVLQSYCTNPDIIPYLKSFCGQNIKSVHTMFINKPPGMGSSSRHPFHQDLAYFPFGPTNRIVAAWAALEDSSNANGSLNILPKTHKGRFFDHEYPDWNGEVNKAYFGIKEYEKFEDNRIDLEMKKGDIVFFHPLLIHGSGENKSQGYRKSLCCHFAASECEYIPIQGTVQQLVSKEVMSYMGRKVPGLTDYYSLWKIKSKLICGRTFEGKL